MVLRRKINLAPKMEISNVPRTLRTERDSSRLVEYLGASQFLIIPRSHLKVQI